jgi:hypothetical protein
MIHDVFVTRYPNPIYLGEHPTPAMHQLFIQVAHIVFADLQPTLKLNQPFFKGVHDVLAREIAAGRLYDASTYDAVCSEFLTERYDLWNDRHGTADQFLKARLSLVELIFRAAEEILLAPSADATSGFARLWSRPPIQVSSERTARTALNSSIRELNDRFRRANMPLHYHNGLLQFAQDELTETRNAEPCWSLLNEPKWANVDRELKEAWDATDNGRSDAAFYAAKALESTIKIISDERGWTTGSERGAANYIDNLASKRSGQFIAQWESELLKALFTYIRNPQGHGAGSKPPLILAPHQTAWAIETVMTWVKSLIRRL